MPMSGTTLLYETTLSLKNNFCSVHLMWDLWLIYNLILYEDNFVQHKNPPSADKENLKSNNRAKVEMLHYETITFTKTVSIQNIYNSLTV